MVYEPTSKHYVTLSSYEQSGRQPAMLPRLFAIPKSFCPRVRKKSGHSGKILHFVVK